MCVFHFAAKLMVLWFKEGVGWGGLIVQSALSLVISFQIQTTQEMINQSSARRFCCTANVNCIQTKALAAKNVLHSTVPAPT